jgi:hypothetical protein
MAEVQTSTNSGAMTQRFVEFVMMHAQNAALFLGQIPNPQSGQAEVNLELAKMFIDQLAMVQEKTRGNLSNEESTVLRNALSNLQMAYVEVAGTGKAAAEPQSAAEPQATAEPQSAAASAASEPERAVPSAQPIETAETDTRKKFTKSYGV